MQLQNIHNSRRLIYLFERDSNGQLHIGKDNSFYPYFYEIDQNGNFDTYDGPKVRKIICSEPREVGQKRSPSSYEADILFPKRYIIDKINNFKKTIIKYLFIDIEILATEMPNPQEAKDPISCITIYNSFSNKYKSWFLLDWKNEDRMLEDFVIYVHNEKPDLILGWNLLNFDYPYLHNRILDFSKKISPINQIRYGEKNTYFPAGISIMDYLIMFKKIYMREQSYALDRIAQKHLKEKTWKKTKFDELSKDVLEKNINDVKRMVKIENQYEIINYYDEIRRFAMCLWEDLTANSKILDVIILREAKKRNIILPNKRKEKISFDLQGAYRRADVGIYHNVYKADVASMYPNQLINFCLDIQNIKSKNESDTIKINKVLIKQNPDALLPSLSKKLINQKNILKKELKDLDIHNQEYENTKNKYDAIKSLVNSIYGIMAFPTFRLFNFTIASTITYLSRSLLKYAEDNMEKMGYKVHYTDTDALIYSAKEDEIDLLNKLVIDWAVENYNKPDVNINFESEGKFTDLLILGKCHYYGNLQIPGGKTKVEIKGIEMKRSSSSKYEAWFQKELIDKILKGVLKEKIIEWIKREKERIRTLHWLEISFPSKIANKKYVHEPIFVRAFNNSKCLFKDFDINKGELFYYIFIKPLGYDKNNKPRDVIAITENTDFDEVKKYIKIDWGEVIRRNIDMKVEHIISVLGWGDVELLLTNQILLF